MLHECMTIFPIWDGLALFYSQFPLVLALFLLYAEYLVEMEFFSMM